MERPIHRVRGCRRPQEPPPPIVHAAPQSWGHPPPPTAAAGRGGPEPLPSRSPPGAAWPPPPRVPSQAAGARRRPLAAARWPPLPNPRRAPAQRRSHARDHLTRTWLRPSPADPRGRGLRGPGPPPSQPVFPLAAADPSAGCSRHGWGCPSSHPARPSPPLAPTSLALCVPALCAGSLILKPQVDPFLSPIGPPQLQPLVGGTCLFPGRVQHRPAGRGCCLIGRLRRDGWILKGLPLSWSPGGSASAPVRPNCTPTPTSVTFQLLRPSGPLECSLELFKLQFSLV
nr:proline-rich protein 2-like [Camelus dromedarius]